MIVCIGLEMTSNTTSVPPLLRLIFLLKLNPTDAAVDMEEDEGRVPIDRSAVT